MLTSSSSQHALQTHVLACSIMGPMGRNAFYNVSDVLQTLGIRDRQFDTIVLHTRCGSASGSALEFDNEFEKYAVFLQQKQRQKQQLPMATSISSAAAAAAIYATAATRVHAVQAPLQDQDDLVPCNVLATFIYYDRFQGRFQSDGAYHEYIFKPESAMSAENAHIANDRFAFYIISGDANAEFRDQHEESPRSQHSQSSCTTDCSGDPICHSDTDSD